MGELIFLEEGREMVFDRKYNAHTIDLRRILTELNPNLVQQIQIKKLAMIERAALADILLETDIPENGVSEDIIRNALQDNTSHWTECLYQDRCWARLYVFPALSRWVPVDNDQAVLNIFRYLGNILRIIRFHNEQCAKTN